MTLIGWTRSAGEGHGSAARVEVNLGPGLEVDLGPGLEVDQGLILKVGQEPKVKVVTTLTPRMSVPVPQTTTGNCQIEE